MNSSRIQSASDSSHMSLSDSLSPLHTDSNRAALPGSFNDEDAIREAITASIRNCQKSREVIAEQMTYLLGSAVTKRSLDSFTSESAEKHRWPAQYTRAFCHITGDWTLLRCVTEHSQFTLIGPEERKLLELGKRYLLQKRTAAAMRQLESDLGEVEL